MSASVSRTGDSPFMEAPRLVRNAWPLAALDTYGQSQAPGLAGSSPRATITQVNLPQPGAAGASNQRGTRASAAVPAPPLQDVARATQQPHVDQECRHPGDAPDVVAG